MRLFLICALSPEEDQSYDLFVRAADVQDAYRLWRLYWALTDADLNEGMADGPNIWEVPGDGPRGAIAWEHIKRHDPVIPGA